MRLILLDRDGVINQDRADYVKSENELELIPESARAIARLNQRGFTVVVISNQSVIGRGLLSTSELDAIHKALDDELAVYGAKIDSYYYCPHHPDDGCSCRKPAPGLILQALADYNADAKDAIFIGDSDKDIEASDAAGVRSLLVLTGHGRGDLDSLLRRRWRGSYFSDLYQAVDYVLTAKRNKYVAIMRSASFNASFLFSIFTFAIFTTLAIPLKHSIIEGIARTWARLFYAQLRFCVGLNYRISGLENLTNKPSIIYIKHQSTWETPLPFVLFRRISFILKRELVWIPFIGWSLLRLGCIPINRSAHRRAIDQIRKTGLTRIRNGFSIILFPEGHRMALGKTRRYGLSGALLARESNVPIIPIAHNAGDFWPRRGFIKQPGTVIVRIGAPIYPDNKTPEQINLEAKEWIESQMKEISQGYHQ